LIKVNDLCFDTVALKASRLWYTLHQDTLTAYETVSMLLAGASTLALCTTASSLALTSGDATTNPFAGLAGVEIEFVVFHYLGSLFAGFFASSAFLTEADFTSSAFSIDFLLPSSLFFLPSCPNHWSRGTSSRNASMVA
jgi:hypothetical protein